MAAHVTFKLAFAVLLVTLVLSAIWIITSEGPRIDPAKVQITREIEGNIAVRNAQSDAMNFTGGQTGDDNLRAMNNARE